MRHRLMLCATLLLAVTQTDLAAGQETSASPAPTHDPARDFVAARPPASAPGPLGRALEAITAPALAAHVARLASPGMDGRGLGGRGLDAAADYVAAALDQAGVAPFGGGSDAGGATWFQTLPLRELPPAPMALEIERRDGELLTSRTFASGVDCLAVPQPPQSLEAPLVFAGLGIREPEMAYDDYRGLDVRGKVVLVLAGLPPGREWQKPELTARYAPEDPDERWDARLETASELGAAAVLAVEPEELPRKLASGELRQETAFRPFEPEAGEPSALVRISRAVALHLVDEAALADAGKTAGLRGARPGIRVRLRFGGEEKVILSRNVIGILPGSDSGRRDEAIVLGAHLDHLGRKGADLYPGADDNASGVAALLEIARAFANLPERPARTLVFAFWTGEEEGHLGSRFYVSHPRWPLPRTIAYLNLDMIGHPWLPEEIRKLVTDASLPSGEAFLAGLDPVRFVEPGLPPGAEMLETALRSAAAIDGLALHLDRTSGRSGGSDYREFARRDVPFLRFFGNYFPDYHEPGDRADRLDAAQVRRVARLALATAWSLANP